MARDSKIKRAERALDNKESVHGNSRKEQRIKNKNLTPSQTEYYKQTVDSPNFNNKKNAVIAQLQMQYWANKALQHHSST
jgi:hypothetical protein